MSLIAVCVASALLLTACGDAEGPTEAQVLEVALVSEPSSLDPGQADNTSVIRALYDSLTVQDPDSGEIEPWLAESWEISEDSTEYTFHLREEVTFSDGSPLDAEAVVANFDSVVESAVIPASYFPGYVESRAVDPLTVRVTFEESNSGFLYATSLATLGIREPSTVIGKSAEERADVDSVVGSGPFVLDSYTADEEISLVRRDDYGWGPSIGDNQGTAHLEGIRFQIVPESSVRTGLLQSGQIHLDGNVQPSDIPANERADLNIESATLPGITAGLYPNLESPRLAETAVRKAIQRAVNRQEIVDTLLTDAYQPARSVLASPTPGFIDLGDQLTFDPDGAIRLLDDAGWVPAENGVREKEGVVLSFDAYYLENTSEQRNVLELVQQQFTDVGLELVLHPTPAADFMEILGGTAHDFTTGNSRGNDPDVLRTSISSEGMNWLHLEEGGEIDSLLREIPTATDPETRNQLAATAAEQLIEEGAVIPLYELAISVGAVGNVSIGFDANAQPDYFGARLNP